MGQVASVQDDSIAGLQPIQFPEYLAMCGVVTVDDNITLLTWWCRIFVPTGGISLRNLPNYLSFSLYLSHVPGYGLDVGIHSDACDNDARW